MPPPPSLDMSQASTRPSGPEDHGAVARLLSGARRHFLAVTSAELPALLAQEPGAALVAGGAVWAAAVAERAGGGTAWLRALALADGLPPDAGLDALLAAYHDRLRAAGVQRAYYAGSDLGDAWVRAALAARGYQRLTEVVVYEKIRLDAPTAGDATLAVRRATPADAETVLALDAAAFDDLWHKDRRAIEPALAGAAPCFLIAERGAPLGYAFATSHYEGRLVHLVRIAVLPEARGAGAGARLLAEVVAYAREARADVLTLNTQADNAPARRLYERFGFRRTGERQTVLTLDL